VYGPYESVRAVPDVDVECHFFTDTGEMAQLAQEAGWTSHHINHGIATLKGDPSVTAPMLAHKWWKTHPELACPDAEVSIWMDGSMDVTEPRYVERCLELLGEDDVTFMAHPERGCIFTEAEYSAVLTWRYDAPSITEQARHYKNFHPEQWELFATGLIIRRHTPTVLELGEQWWHENLRWSHQDQLSLPVLVRLLEEKGLKWNKNLKWLMDGGVHLRPHGS
jgi:hypothetical protein